MKKRTTKMVTITLKIDTVAELQEYSKQSLIPMSALIQRLVETFLSQQKKGDSDE